MVVGAVVPLLLMLAYTGLDFLAFGPVPYIVFFLLLAGILVVWRLVLWTAILAAIGFVGALVIVAGDPVAGSTILQPTVYPEHAVINSILLVAVSGLVASIAAIVAQRKGTAHPMARPHAGPVAVLVVVGLILGFIIVGWEVHRAPTAGAGAVALTPDATLATKEQGDKFVPADLQVPLGKIVKITVENADSGGHNFHWDEIGLAADNAAGKSTDLWVQAKTAGTFQFYCSIHSAKGSDGKWAGMVGTVTVA